MLPYQIKQRREMILVPDGFFSSGCTSSTHRETSMESPNKFFLLRYEWISLIYNQMTDDSTPDFY
jgi:hypothetical protein